MDAMQGFVLGMGIASAIWLVTGICVTRMVRNHFREVERPVRDAVDAKWREIGRRVPPLV